MTTSGEKFKEEFLESVELAGPEQLRLLDQAADTLDQIESMKAQIDEEGLTVPGSKGQDVAHPLLPQLRAARSEFAKLVKELTPEGPVTIAQERARHASRRAWSNGRRRPVQAAHADRVFIPEEFE